MGLYFLCSEELEKKIAILRQAWIGLAYAPDSHNYSLGLVIRGFAHLAI
jgi:hypothetical protein